MSDVAMLPHLRGNAHGNLSLRQVSAVESAAVKEDSIAQANSRHIEQPANVFWARPTSSGQLIVATMYLVARFDRRNDAACSFH
jgi:hypothetical protein